MAKTAPRVVVLGNAGEAQQQLLNALKELGADTVAVGDFDQLDPVKMREQQPDVWLVSIDEATDSGRLERWQPLFDDPDATVIFDDADVTRRLSGWDLARWARHLAAKVLGRDDVLPPVSPDAERLPQPAAGEEAPDAGSQTQDAGEIDFGDLVLSTPEDESSEVAPVPVEAAEAEPAGTVELSLMDDADFAALNASFESERTQRESQDDAPAMALDDLLFAQSEAAADGTAPPAAGASAAAPAQAGSAPAQTPAKATLSLLDLNVDLSTPKVVKAAEPDVKIDVSHLELAPLEEPEEITSTAASGPKTNGLIAIIAGLGGPDAVRQFLGALPENLPAPVLLWQHLDAGKHDRLAQQLAKATKLPVYLAKPGDEAKAGQIAVMGAGLGVVDDGGWKINKGSPSPSHGLAPALKDKKSVLVVLSGAEPVVVEFARAHKASGGDVLVQTASTCFDGIAASALESQGIASGAPADLAVTAAKNWPTPA